MNFFIEEHHNNLSKEFCRECIRKFDTSNEIYNGISGHGYNPQVKDSHDLQVTSSKFWKDEDKIFFESLKDPVNNYLKNVVYPYNSLPETFDTGYQIQRTSPLQKGYVLHDDLHSSDGDVRVVTYIWYLNTVEEGGTTEFRDGTKIKPEEGKLILFPPFYTHAHKGNPPKKKNKYICTGWIYANMNY